MRNFEIFVIPYTGAPSFTVGIYLLLQSLAGSKMVEVSEDRKHMRTRNDPGKWSLAGVEPTSFSTLDASVPEFVPGQTFRVPTAQSTAPPGTVSQFQSSVGNDPTPVDATGKDETVAVDSEVSARLDEMSISMVTAAEATRSEDASPAAAAAVSENQVAAAIDRLNSPSHDDKQPGAVACIFVHVLRMWYSVAHCD